MRSKTLLENQRKRQHQIMFGYSIYNDENPFGWDGNIDSIVYRKFYASEKDENGILWEELCCSEMEFNTQGNVSQITEYRKDELFSRCLREYDDEGNLIIEKSYNAQGENGTEIKYKYNRWGDLIEKVILHAQEPSIKYLYTYDRQGKLIQTLEHNISGKYKYWTTYLYNEDGNIVMRAEMFPNGLLGEIDTYSYDKNGNNESKILRESFESFICYEYDNEGKVIKSIEKSHSLESESTDKCDNEISQAWYEEFEYDAKGNVISSIEREGSEIFYRHEWIIKYRK